METLHSRDRNLFFRYTREKYIAPQTKGNLYLPYIEGTKQKWERIPIPSGQDQNTFFRVNKTPQPVLMTRVLDGVLNPLDSTIGQLPKTTAERQANTIVKSIEGILGSLRGFMSAEEKDDEGNVVLDPITNQPVVRIRTITEILTVAHGALQQVFQAANVVPGNNQLLIMNSFSVNSSIVITERIRDLEKSDPTMSQDSREQLYGDILIKERIKNDDAIADSNTDLIDAMYEAVDEQKIDDAWDDAGNNTIFDQQWYSPKKWKDAYFTRDYDFMQFIMKREKNQGIQLTTSTGTPIGLGRRQLIMGGEFGRKRYLDLDTLAFFRITSGAIPNIELDVADRGVAVAPPGAAPPPVPLRVPLRPSAAAAAAAVPPPSAAPRRAVPTAAAVTVPPPSAPRRTAASATSAAAAAAPSRPSAAPSRAAPSRAAPTTTTRTTPPPIRRPSSAGTSPAVTAATRKKPTIAVQSRVDKLVTLGNLDMKQLTSTNPGPLSQSERNELV